jgi:hypothetical protein
LPQAITVELFTEPRGSGEDKVARAEPLVTPSDATAVMVIGLAGSAVGAI